MNSVEIAQLSMKQISNNNGIECAVISRHYIYTHSFTRSFIDSFSVELEKRLRSLATILHSIHVRIRRCYLCLWCVYGCVCVCNLVLWTSCSVHAMIWLQWIHAINTDEWCRWWPLPIDISVSHFWFFQNTQIGTANGRTLNQKRIETIAL